MKLDSLYALLCSLSWPILVSASPTVPSAKFVGAVYSITNEPSGNYILASGISADGKLAFGSITHAGGIGSIGIDPTLPGDPLFSQGSVVVSSERDLLATVNGGSNTVALFKIDPSDPTHLTMVGKPVGSGGEFPTSVAFNMAGTVVCVLNGGAVNGVRCFDVDALKGLSVITHTTKYLNLNETTPPSGPLGSVSQVIFANKDKSLMVAVKGNPSVGARGYLAFWDFEHDGSLSKEYRTVFGNKAVHAPFGITPVRGANAILTADAALGYDIWDFTGSKGLAQDDWKITDYPVAGQAAICWSTYSPKTGNYYLVDFKDVITEVSVDCHADSHIVKQYNVTKGSFTLDTDIGTVKGNDYMYTLVSAVPGVLVHSIIAPGDMQQIQVLNYSAPTKKAGIVAELKALQGLAVYAK
ncbi:hypothetical protein APHAL10511_007738 [Amanita phalloides]|nr:hypothetical protein APHAL10511_007738 [Amanita phalloides]